MVFDWDFLGAFFSIVMIDLVLAGDNAVVISMAVRRLPEAQRKTGLIFGALAAVILRVVLTFFAAQLLTLGYVKFFGGALLVWIAVRLAMEGGRENQGGKEAATLKEAIGIILVADVVMSLDNILAIAGASGGNVYLVIFGLALSIPIVVLASTFFSELTDRYPVILYAGIAVLGRVAGQMMITDPVIVDVFEPGKAVEYSTQAAAAAVVVLIAVFRNRRKALKTCLKSSCP